MYKFLPDNLLSYNIRILSTPYFYKCHPSINEGKEIGLFNQKIKCFINCPLCKISKVKNNSLLFVYLYQNNDFYFMNLDENLFCNIKKFAISYGDPKNYDLIMHLNDKMTIKKLEKSIFQKIFDQDKLNKCFKLLLQENESLEQQLKIENNLEKYIKLNLF